MNRVFSRAIFGKWVSLVRRVRGNLVLSKVYMLNILRVGLDRLHFAFYRTDLTIRTLDKFCLNVFLNRIELGNAYDILHKVSTVNDLIEGV